MKSSKCKHEASEMSTTVSQSARPEEAASASPISFSFHCFSPVMQVRDGDLFESRMQTLVNTVNCFGVMGKGVALAFKNKYPAMFTDYRKRCQNKEVKIGYPYLYKAQDGRFIVNFPTKQHWRNPSQLFMVERGLEYLAQHIREWGITSIAFPALGCGNGGLRFGEVLPLIKKYIEPLRIPFEVYSPATANFGTKHRLRDSSTNMAANPPRRVKISSFFPPAAEVAAVADAHSAGNQALHP